MQAKAKIDALQSDRSMCRKLSGHRRSTCAKNHSQTVLLRKSLPISGNFFEIVKGPVKC